MKAQPGILDALQEVLTMELTGINQYFLHAKMLGNWGYGRLAKIMWDESMDEMRHADKIMDRMLMLEGVPNMTRYEKVIPGESPLTQIEANLDLEYRAVDVLRRSIQVCFDTGDHVTRELFEHILADEEEHIDFFEAEVQKTKDMGLENWLATQQLPHTGNPD